MRRTIIQTSIAAIALAVPFMALAQWVPAPANPPSNNAAAPINVSGSNQAKTGGLEVGSFLSDGGAVVMGNLGVGVVPSSYAIQAVGDISGTRLCIGTDCRNAWPSGGGGSVTINTGGGVTGGAVNTNTFNLSIDNTTIQSRITGTCLGQVMVGVNQNGTVNCENDDTGGGAPALTLDNVIVNGPNTTNVPKFQGGIDLGNGDTSGGASDTAGIKAWNILNIYSSCCGYTSAANYAISLNARTGDATFKGNITTADGGYKSGMWCGRGHTGTNNYTKVGAVDGDDGPDMPCQGTSPAISCPTGFTKVNFAFDTRSNEQTVKYITCIKN